ncbi:NAD(P)/FAD-dependent oxidoreductase [Streptomyces sulphureus]|uniref:NAD(P)/FAD-dependent oxidoreductase n=1 Tax=Streptomyces sulphureus TaxID=47758 RepID=UPI00039C0962|nr:FAD-dependent oxidoreductase [Streptomyces sulphureus]
MSATAPPVRILLIGAGHVGATAARRLSRRLGPRLADPALAPRRSPAHDRGAAPPVHLTVVNPTPRTVYRPLLPEAAAGSLPTHHAAAPLRRLLPSCRIVIGEAESVDHRHRTAYVRTPADRSPLALRYDHLVLAPGAGSEPPRAPGIAEHAFGTRALHEVTALGNHLVHQLDLASSTRDPAVRDAALTFVFEGGDAATVALLAELAAAARRSCRDFGNLAPEELRFLLAVPEDRLLPEYEPPPARRTLAELRDNNVDVRLGASLASCTPRLAVLDDGTRLPAHTVVRAAPTAPHPLLVSTDLPRTRDGFLRCTPALQLDGVRGAWSAGASAALTSPEAPAPTPAHSRRQGLLLAENLAAELRGEPLVDYRHTHASSAIPLGPRRAVAQLQHRTLSGTTAWLWHRGHHLTKLPAPRGVGLVAEWTLALLFRREIVSLNRAPEPGGTRNSPPNSGV